MFLYRRDNVKFLIPTQPKARRKQVRRKNRPVGIFSQVLVYKILLGRQGCRKFAAVDFQEALPLTPCPFNPLPFLCCEGLCSPFNGYWISTGYQVWGSRTQSLSSCFPNHCFLKPFLSHRLPFSDLLSNLKAGDWMKKTPGRYCNRYIATWSGCAHGPRHTAFLRVWRQGNCP